MCHVIISSILDKLLFLIVREIFITFTIILTFFFFFSKILASFTCFFFCCLFVFLFFSLFALFSFRKILISFTCIFWHYLSVKKLSALLYEITLKHDGDFYCLNCLHSCLHCLLQKTNLSVI